MIFPGSGVFTTSSLFDSIKMVKRAIQTVIDGKWNEELSDYLWINIGPSPSIEYCRKSKIYTNTVSNTTISACCVVMFIIGYWVGKNTKIWFSGILDMKCFVINFDPNIVKMFVNKKISYLIMTHYILTSKDSWRRHFVSNGCSLITAVPTKESPLKKPLEKYRLRNYVIIRKYQLNILKMSKDQYGFSEVVLMTYPFVVINIWMTNGVQHIVYICVRLHCKWLMVKLFW